jgi:predicted oxidoreductase
MSSQKHTSGILPVLGTTKIERLQQALAAQLIQLTTEQWFMIWRASTGEEVA